jgi:hypothetical protein
MRHLLLLFLLPAFTFATTVRDAAQYEMQQIAGSVAQYLLKYPDAVHETAGRLAEMVTAEHKEGAYLRFDKTRISSDGLLALNGKPYLILISNEGICVLMPDATGNYNGREAKHYYQPARAPIPSK